MNAAKDSTRTHTGEGGPGPVVVLFDGVCNLCNGWVNWAIDRDPRARILFLPQQTPAGAALLADAGLGDVPLSTIVAIHGGRALVRSAAILAVARALDGPWPRLATACRAVPAPLRDLVYRSIASIRYGVFGRSASCRVPTPALACHFLDPDDILAARSVAGFVGGKTVPV
ncbi:MAG: DUF393 domain-containing protein [Flavobacteriales bacterium]|nr:DUF393 domain-containing protein [Flavobacteriales bacterium]MCB9168544.1 DUF393 domain-containing protein [Flavobacteriales bacterium]